MRILKSLSGAGRSRSGPRPGKRWGKKAAAGVLLLVIGAVGHEFWRVVFESAVHHIAQEFSSTTETVVRTDVGKQRRLALPDGSVLRANVSSDVQVTQSRESREVRIREGEVLLQVAQGARPMAVFVGDVIVEAESAAIRVLRHGPEACDIYVSEGEVVLYVGDGRGWPTLRQAALRTVRVRAGRMASVKTGAVVISRYEPRRFEREIAWTVGQIWLEGETLAFAVAEFNRHNRVRLVIGSRELEGLKIGGRFKATDVESFVLALEQRFGIRAFSMRGEGEEGGVIVLTKARRAAVASGRELGI